VPEPPSHYLKKHYYDITASYYPSSLRCALDFVGIDHLLFGTDYPYSRDGRVEKTKDYIEAYGFTGAEKARIYSGNAMDLFIKI
jgi:predicted TIM-barrel fold metal-dependent hydrolase